MLLLLLLPVSAVGRSDHRWCRTWGCRYCCGAAAAASLCVSAAQLSSVVSAAPLRCTSRAMATPSAGEEATEQAASA